MVHPPCYLSQNFLFTITCFQQRIEVPSYEILLQTGAWWINELKVTDMFIRMMTDSEPLCIWYRTDYLIPMMTCTSKPCVCVACFVILTRMTLLYTDSNLNIVLNNDLRCFLNVSRLSIGLSCDGRKDRQLNGHDWLHTIARVHLYMPPGCHDVISFLH